MVIRERRDRAILARLQVPVADIPHAASAGQVVERLAAGSPYRVIRAVAAGHHGRELAAVAVVEPYLTSERRGRTRATLAKITNPAFTLVDEKHLASVWRKRRCVCRRVKEHRFGASGGERHENRAARITDARHALGRIVAESGCEKPKPVRRIGARNAALGVERKLAKAAGGEAVCAKRKFERHVGPSPARKERNLLPVWRQDRRLFSADSVAERNHRATGSRCAPDAPAPCEHEKRTVGRDGWRLGEIYLRPVALGRSRFLCWNLRRGYCSDGDCG